MNEQMTDPANPRSPSTDGAGSNSGPAAGTIDFDANLFRTALSQFATGITIITATGPAGRRVGVTANSFNSVSLTPPLVLWSLAHKSGSFDAFAGCTHFAVNVLAASQEDLARHFAQHAADKFAGIDLITGLGGCLLLPGALAQFECRNRSRYPEGDHTIFVGEVERFACTGGSPLIYQGRHYHAGFGHPTA